MSVQHAHPELGKVLGKAEHKVLHFLGIQYATLKHRLADAKLPEYSASNELNATRYGPSAISPPNACDMEHLFIQHALPHEDFSFSETECLNLNIFVPKIAKADLPVFVLVHGGGFGIGSNAWPQYDLSAFVERSAERGTPVIAVNLNYRLGVFGFLTSPELRNAGYSSNNGLRDQLAAFTWIKKYISGFGGDPHNVTIGGESAGAVSCLIHADQSDPPFKRVVSMGGTPLLLKPLSPPVAASVYLSVAEKLGLSAMSPEDRIKALLSVSPEEVLAKIPPSLPLLPVNDGEIVQVPYTFSRYTSSPTGQDCESLLIGDCGLDSSILFYMLHQRLPTLVSDFHKSIAKSLADHPDIRSQLLKEYGIGEEESPEHLQSILNFAHDVGFYGPAREIAKSWPGKVYMYHFNEVNTWDGRWKGFSTHILDVAFVFLNYQQFLSVEQQRVAINFCDDVLDFVSGREAFPTFKAGQEGAKVYGPGPKGARYVQSTKSEDFGRRTILFDLAQKVGLDTLSNSWDVFMAGQ